MDKTKIILFAVGGLVLVVIIAVVMMNPFKEPTPAPATLEVWNVFDDSDIWDPLINKYKTVAPNVTINYSKKSIISYEQDLVNALAAGRGPDVLFIHNTWLPKHENKLAPAPATLISTKRFGELFADVASQDFVNAGKIYALPLSIDTLALFYNKDLLNSAGITMPPRTWTEFNSAVEKLTQRDSKNNILQSGAALGAAKNINRSTDILAALMLQSGAKMVNDSRDRAAFDETVTTQEGTFNPGRQALIFYTNFASPGLKVYTWNQYQKYSIDAFVEGKTAMMLSYNYQLPLIKARAAHLEMDVAPFPQISSTSKKVTFANYWAPAVSLGSKNQNEAWKFLTWLASPEISRQYLEIAEKPAARRDLIEEQKSNKDLGIFADQALTAKSWWEKDNLAIEGIFAEMIESVNTGKLTAENALRQAAAQVNLLMRGN
jgi:multiple sugar transport system substrate-binding protein